MDSLVEFSEVVLVRLAVCQCFVSSSFLDIVNYSIRESLLEEIYVSFFGID